MGIMKKFLFLVLLVLSVFAANVFAGELDVWGGYGICTKYISDQESSDVCDVISSKGDSANVSTAGLDYFFDNDKNVKPGLRVAYSRSGEQITTFKRKIDGSTYDVSSGRFSIASAMFGGKMYCDISENFRLNVKLFAGVVRKKNDSASIVRSIADIEYMFVFEQSIGVRYLFTEKFGLGLDLGFEPAFQGHVAKLGLNFKI
ncbi:hypothetical protein AGMMS49936_10380 [Endomicrobiia bacterium]|nr:hypothetical protein AGMMS49936_10380 [Endomicrobiia bacterium]